RRSIRPGADLPLLDDERLAQVVRAARTGDVAARESRRAPVSTTRVPGVTTATTLAILQHAARARSDVWLGYVDAHGGTATRKVRPVSIGAGYLRAEDERTDVLHTFALHRITSAAPVEE
ncbi:MAG TPA: DNA-binding protein, partial [Mycobacteriales bacterium]|nr:DNA-binding protein [Mycobacteriales bacterium]